MMNGIHSSPKKEDEVMNFLARVFGITIEELSSFRQLPNFPDNLPPGVTSKMTGVMSLKNQPEFFADAPWRLEPDQDSLWITIYIRDANAQSIGYSPWRLDNLLIELLSEQQSWFKLISIIPPISPGVDFQGNINQDFWVHNIHIPISEMPNWSHGNYAHLRVKFSGSPFPHKKTSTIERHLEILRSGDALPLGRASTTSGPRKWFYGDTHYHSAYTNDIKEYGAPIPETRRAAQAVGLDWLVITDHSTDLDEIDPGYAGISRWNRLKTELSIPEISDDRFRFILGEEITLMDINNGLVHMLAIGAMDEMIDGAFLPEEGKNIQIDLWRQLIENIIKFGQGYPGNLPQQLFGAVNRFENVLEMLPDKTLTFAAHPYNIAQVPPTKWDKNDLNHPRLTGLEFWNGRCRKSAKQSDNPFSRKSWKDPARLKSSDEARIKKLFQLVQDLWEPHLVRGTEEWTFNTLLPNHRPVFVGGSDAHGDFNYHAGMAWDYSKTDMMDDNGVGRVRTAIFLPEHQSASVPEVDAILGALKKGACVVTDGPILEFSLRQKEKFAYMGESLLISSKSELDMKILAYSTPEFGLIENVELVTYFKGQRSKKPALYNIKPGEDISIQLVGSQGYCRLQARTIGLDGEQFCCFTNPIWFRLEGGSTKTLRVTFSRE